MLNKPGYSWRVIHDPTRTGEDPGLFFGGHFRSIDIELPKSLGHSKIPCPWPSGMIFENIHTGEKIQVKQDKIIHLNNHNNDLKNNPTGIRRLQNG